jgi:hypothetical protein
MISSLAASFASAPSSTPGTRRPGYRRPGIQESRPTTPQPTAIQPHDVAVLLASLRPDGERPASVRGEGGLWLALRAALADTLEARDPAFDRTTFLARTER